jgi:hypothetical protein
LLDEAAADLREILNDVDGGFATPITITNPEGVSAVVNGLQTDIGLSIDPETGLSVSGRRASVAVSLADLAEAGLAIPENVPEKTRTPWLVEWTPPTGAAQVMKVTDTQPDKLGCVVLQLERYKR